MCHELIFQLPLDKKHLCSKHAWNSFLVKATPFSIASNSIYISNDVMRYTVYVSLHILVLFFLVKCKYAFGFTKWFIYTTHFVFLHRLVEKGQTVDTNLWKIFSQNSMGNGKGSSNLTLSTNYFDSLTFLICALVSSWFRYFWFVWNSISVFPHFCRHKLMKDFLTEFHGEYQGKLWSLQYWQTAYWRFTFVVFQFSSC